MLVTVAGQGLKVVLQLGSLVILSRLLSPQDFGVVAAILSIVGIATVLGDLGLSLAAARVHHLSQQQKTNLFWLNAGVGAVICLLFVCLAPAIAAFYGSSLLQGATVVLALVFLLNGLSGQYKTELMRSHQFGWLIGSEVAGQAGGLVVGIVMAVSGFGFWSLVGQQLAVYVVILCVLVGKTRWCPGLPRKGSAIGSIVRVGAGTSALQVGTYISSNADNIVVGRVAGLVALGLYSRSYQILMIPVQQLIAPLTRVVVPLFAALRSDELLQAVKSTQAVLSYVLLPVLGLAASVAPAAFPLVLGEAWGNASVLFQILTIGGVFQVVGYSNYWLFLIRGKTGLLAALEAVARIVMVAAIIVCGIYWGAVGVAWAVTFGLAAVWFVVSAFGLPAVGVGRWQLARASRNGAMLGLLVFAASFSMTALGRGLSLSDGYVLSMGAGGCALGVAAFCAVPGLRSNLVGVLREGLRGPTRSGV